jgi:hypothetical protein
MYSRKAWGGAVEPFILTKFIKVPDEIPGDPIVSLIIFEWKDEPLIGIKPFVIVRRLDNGFCHQMPRNYLRM